MPHWTITRVTLHGSPGLTLLEVVMAMGILVPSVLSTGLMMADTYHQSRILGMEINARHAMTAQMEEVLGVASDELHRYGVAAQAIIAHYSSPSITDAYIPDANGELLPKAELNPDGTALLYRFPIVDHEMHTLQPGEAELFGIRRPNHNATGVMIIYLDEEAVGPNGEDDRFMWEDLGDHQDGLSAGFDMNGDGSVSSAPGSITLEKLHENPSELGIVHLPIDFVVTYYDDASHERPILRTVRRMIASDSTDISHLLEGNGVLQ